MKASIRMWQRRITTPAVKRVTGRILRTVKSPNNINLNDPFGFVYFLFLIGIMLSIPAWIIFLSPQSDFQLRSVASDSRIESAARDYCVRQSLITITEKTHAQPITNLDLNNVIDACKPTKAPEEPIVDKQRKLLKEQK